MSVRRLERTLRQQGYIVGRTGGGHVAIRHPTLPGVVYAASSPSDRRAMLNLYAELERRFVRCKAGARP